MSTGARDRGTPEVAALRRANADLRDRVGRLEAERARLQAANDAFARAEDAMAEGLLVIDAQGVVRRANAAAARILGAGSAAELVGRARVGIATPGWTADGEPRPADAWPSQITRRTGRAVDRQLLRVRLPAGERWLEVSSRPAPEGEGPPFGVVVTFADVTERVGAEQALRHSEERFRSLVDSVAQALLVIDPQGRVLLANPAAGALAGEDAERIVGRRLDELRWQPVDAEGRRVTPPEPADAAERGIAAQGVLLEMADRTGERRWLGVSVAPFGPGPPYAVVLTATDVTARVVAQARLAESEHRFRTLAEHASDTISWWDMQGNLLYVSPVGARRSGWPAEELAARMVTGELVHPDDHEVLADIRAALARGEEPSAARIRTRRRDGSWIWTEERFALVRDDGGRPAELVLVSRDITAQVEAEQALAASEERYRLLAEGASDVISLWDLDELRALYISPAGERLTGHSTEALMRGVGAGELTHPDDLAAGMELMAALRRGERTPPVRMRTRHADGRWIWTEDRHTLLPSPGGGPRRFVAVTRDITAQVEAEQALAASEARFRVVAETSSDLIMRLAPDGTILWASPSAVRVSGYEPHELLGRRPVQLVHPEDHERLLLHGGRHIEPGALALVRLRHRDGHWIWAEISYGPLRDDEGELAEVHISLRDVTARVAHEQAERERVREREELVALTSHELRAPLGALAGLLWLVAEDAEGLGEPARRRLAAARARLAQLRRLAGDLTTMTQLDARSLVLRPDEVDLADLVAGIVDGARLESDRAGLGVELDARRTRVLVDRQRITQVVDNLLSNAIKFSAPGGRVWVHVEGDFASARVSVTDEGPGIPAGDRERLFMRFARGAGTETVPGSGLGLAIARAVAEAHGGEVRLEDPPGGRGLRVVLELPRE